MKAKSQFYNTISHSFAMCTEHFVQKNHKNAAKSYGVLRILFLFITFAVQIYTAQLYIYEI